MSEILAKLLTDQKATELELFGHDLDTMSVRQRVEFFRWNILAVTDELHEALGETSWKPWKGAASRINNPETLEELVDALTFLMNLLLVVSPGFTPEKLAAEIKRVYEAKQQTIRIRQAEEPYQYPVR